MTQSDQPTHRYTAELAGAIETTRQQAWDKAGVFTQPNPGEPDWDASKPRYYCLDMFPYPSGAGLHVGHPEGYTATDIICRYKKMKGFNVLHPMGWDAFGLPAEQYAIQTGVHPEITTKKAIDNFRRQLQRFGFCYDWSREFGTIDPDYYAWTQWIFLKIYDAWFDTDANIARPIDELIERLESGALPAAFNPNAAEYASAGEGGGELFTWSGLDEETRRAIIDSYRLAYIAEQTVNWCPKLGTALANEEVIDGRSERGGFPVMRKPLRQWQFRITAYADRLLDGLAELDWPSSTRTMQAEWIGKSEGAHIDFDLADAPAAHAGLPLRVFTTRPDTVFGATFMVVAPEHPLVEAVLEERSGLGDRGAIRAYVDAARNRTDIERQENKEKTGVALGIDAINPATGTRIPVWTADYVLMGYGTGAIMAVPGQDERDWAFAEAFGLKIVRTVQPPEGFDGKAFTGDGPAMNSRFLDGMPKDEAKRVIIDWLEEAGKGTRKTNYRLRDWLFSRQRYWGEPFPIVFDDRGHHHAVDESTLPVVLPPMEDYQPIESDDPLPLLGKATEWINTTAGAVGVKGLPADAHVRREANTMPGWAGSCWYYLRYADPRNTERFIGRDADKAWHRRPLAGKTQADVDACEGFDAGVMQPGAVDLYVGGAEHAVLHLLYARFWHKALFDLGEVATPEPFQKLYHQGLILSHAYQRADKSLVPTDMVENRGTEDAPEYIEIETGEKVTQIIAKMSKSLKNVVNPDDVIADFGADAFRLYEMYMGPLDQSKPWDTRAIGGMFGFLKDAWRLCINEESGTPRLAETPNPDIEKTLHRTIAKVGSDIERLAFNTAIASMIEFKNAATPKGGIKGSAGSLTADQMDRFVRILAPFAPHLADEIADRLGRLGTGGDKPLSLIQAGWPAYDEAMLTDDEIEIPVQILGKVRGKITVAADADQKTTEATALADEKIKAQLEGKTVRKVIVVPGRMVNIVAN